jgi:RNA polymerase sigma-70 factor (ECF subfamily)
VNPTDEVDWSLASLGDGPAFGRVFDRHRDRVYGHALRLVASVHDAEDVAAITFLELWRRRADARLTAGSLLPWLLVTATNVSLNQRRSARRYRQFLGRLPHPGTSPPAEAEALAGVGLSLDPALLAEIRRLGEVDRALLVLIGIEGFSIAQAGAALDLTEAAARSRWQRLRRRMASRLTIDATPPLEDAPTPGSHP